MALTNSPSRTSPASETPALPYRHNVNIQPDRFYTVELSCRPVKHGIIFLHYFLRIPQLNLEVHPGRYNFGTHHTLGKTTHYGVLRTYYKCGNCLVKLLQDAQHIQTFPLWPLVNCETLSRLLCEDMAISFQTIEYFTISFLILIGAAARLYNLILIGFIILIITVSCRIIHVTSDYIEYILMSVGGGSASSVESDSWDSLTGNDAVAMLGRDADTTPTDTHKRSIEETENKLRVAKEFMGYYCCVHIKTYMK